MIGAGGVSPVPGSGQGDYPQYHGIFYGAVSNNADPKKKNRCTLRVPQLLGSAVTTWALPLTPLVDPPAVGTLVAVMFTGGDLDNPVYLVVYPKVAIETNSGNVQPIGVTSSAGTSHKVAAADHVHGNIETSAANIQPVTSGATASAGTSAKVSRADHVHAANVQGLGTGGFNEVSSSLASGGDVAATIDLLSRFFSGQTEIDLNATNVVASNNFSCNNIVVATAPTDTSFSIAGGNTIPGTTPNPPTQAWGNNVRDTVATLYGGFNALFTAFENMYNNIYT